MGASRLQYISRILAVTLLGASSCSASTPRVLRTNSHCIRANGQPLCPGDEFHLDSDFVTISAGFPDNSRILKTWAPFWEETLWIGSHSYLTLPGFDKSMKNIFFGDDSCLYGNVGWKLVTTNAQLIKCVNQHYVGEPYPNPWAVRDYGLFLPQNQLDLSEPAHNKKGADYFDYRKVPSREGDPNNKLPAYNGLNPILRGKHQNSQWGTENVDYPKADPPVFDVTAPPLSYPPTKIRPIRPYPAPGVGKMPDIYELEPFLPPCPMTNQGCNKKPTPEEIRKQGSASDPNINVAMMDSSVGSAPAAIDSYKNAETIAGTIVSDATDTGSASTDTTVPAAGNTVASTDGTTFASTDGAVSPTDSTMVASTDSTAPLIDLSVPSTDTSVASLPLTDTTNQDLTTQTGPNDTTFVGQKKSRRSFLHPRDFRVQMR